MLVADELRFKVTTGAYAGDYSIDPMNGFTANETLAFRQVFSCGIVSALQGGVDSDVVAGLVWLIRRRQAKALPFSAVADTITLGNLEFVGDDQPAPTEDLTDPER